jgi:hypothetical protein
VRAPKSRFLFARNDKGFVVRQDPGIEEIRVEKANLGTQRSPQGAQRGTEGAEEERFLAQKAARNGVINVLRQWSETQVPPLRGPSRGRKALAAKPSYADKPALHCDDQRHVVREDVIRENGVRW